MATARFSVWPDEDPEKGAQEVGHLTTKPEGAVESEGTVSPLLRAQPSSFPWPTGAQGRGGIEYGPLLEATRLLQDRLAGAALPTDCEVRLTAELVRIADELMPFQVGEDDRVDGLRHDLPGRGSPLLLPFVIEEHTDLLLRGRVTFRRFHLGGNGTAHGGTLPLLFDDVLGKVANSHLHGRGRTAYLTVNFRKVTPIGEELFVDATLDRVEGRKRWASGRLFASDGSLLVDANALFLRLLDGQP